MSYSRLLISKVVDVWFSGELLNGERLLTITLENGDKYEISLLPAKVTKPLTPYEKRENELRIGLPAGINVKFHYYENL